MLCAATLAPKTALSQCSSEMKLVLVEHVRCARDVARDEDAVGHHAVDVEGAATGVAGHAPEAGRQARRPPAIRCCGSTRATPPPRRRRAWSRRRVEHAARVRSRPLPACSTETPTRRSTPCVPLHLGGDLADHAAERTDERRGSALGDGHLEAELPADRGHLRADEAGADDQDPLRLGGQCRLQPARVLGRANREQTLQLGLLLVEPGPRADAGGDQQPVVRDLVAIGQAHVLGSAIETGGGHAEPPFRIDFAAARQQGVIGRHPPFQHLLRERRPIVRLVLLIADEGQLAGEALVAQGFGSAEPGQGGADDDDPAVGLERCYDGRNECRSAHDFACFPLSAKSTMIACTGQDAAARRTR